LALSSDQASFVPRASLLNVQVTINQPPGDEAPMNVLLYSRSRIFMHHHNI
jgi:hypothetical protein